MGDVGNILLVLIAFACAAGAIAGFVTSLLFMMLNSFPSKVLMLGSLAGAASGMTALPWRT